MSYASDSSKSPLSSTPIVVNRVSRREVAWLLVQAAFWAVVLVSSVSTMVGRGNFALASNADAEMLLSTNAEYTDGDKEISVLTNEVSQNECNSTFTTLADVIKGPSITVNGQLIHNQEEATVACHNGDNRVSYADNVTDYIDNTTN